jgi:hypothetical protein
MPFSPEDNELLSRRFIEISEENAQLKSDLDKAQREGAADDILNRLIEPTSRNVFRVMCVYCAFVALIITMNSFGCFKSPIQPDVLKILVGSTAATVIGLVGMVLTGVFIGARQRRK